MLGVDDQYTEYAQHCYDATWALALALNHTIAGYIDLFIIMLTCDMDEYQCGITC